MAYSSRRLLTSLITFTAVALVVACATNGGGEELLEATSDEAGATEPPPPGAVLPGATDAAADAAKDAAKEAGKDGGKEAGKEAGVDAGKPAPNEGAACATLDEIFPRSCGACGTQEAICLAKPDGTPGIVSPYSGCVNELAGGCLSGTSMTESCGNCGTRTRVCTQYCAFNSPSCAGEPVNSCTPTATDYTSAGCVTAGTVRTRACGGVCTWTNWTTTCGTLDFKLIVGATSGDSVSGIYPLRAQVSDKRIGGTCPNGYFSSTTNHPYAYVELVNPTGFTLTMSAWNTAASTTSPIVDTLMTWYPGNVKPITDAERKTCAKGVGDSCPGTLPCGDYKWAGLTGATAITLPPFGSALVFFGSYYAAGSGSVAEGDVKLVIRTDSAL